MTNGFIIINSLFEKAASTNWIFEKLKFTALWWCGVDSKYLLMQQAMRERSKKMKMMTVMKWKKGEKIYSSSRAHEGEEKWVLRLPNVMDLLGWMSSCHEAAWTKEQQLKTMAIMAAAVARYGWWRDHEEEDDRLCLCRWLNKVAAAAVVGDAATTSLSDSCWNIAADDEDDAIILLNQTTTC